MATHLWVIDRIHPDKVILVCDDGRAASAAPGDLPADLEERVVLRAASDAAGTPDWSTAEIDRDETERRRQQSAAMLKKLRQSDQHGFLESP